MKNTIVLAALLIAVFAVTAHAEIVVSSGDTITLSWVANPEPDVAEYDVLRADAIDGTWVLFATVATNGHVIEPLTLPEGDSYFALIAIDEVGNRSGMSEPSELVRNDNTPPGQPSRITIEVVAE